MKDLYKGNEAIAEAAIRAGCRAYFGYPITPQNEIPEYMSRRMPEVGGVFIQAESETSAINMVYGAAGAGARAMTSSSSPGVSLKQEGISYLTCAEVPCVIINMMRAGPGLGGVLPGQGDYFQAVKGGGHGDYRLFVLAPSCVQEACDLTFKAFDIADEYRNPVMILGDGMLGQMIESAQLPQAINLDTLPSKPWATSGHTEPRIINSLLIDPDELEKRTDKLFAKYKLMEKDVMVEEYCTHDANIILTAFGSVGRIAKASVEILRSIGIKAGLIRPITLFPFPYVNYMNHCNKQNISAVYCIELNKGQMVEDVRLAVNGKKPVHFFGRSGGNMLSAEVIAKHIAQEERKK
jgi:2-oxoglutarate ferredoxin oxidoreductase subunit alpha